MALGLSAAPALANPPDADGCHDHKPCGPGGGDDGGTPTIVPTVAQWGGDIDGRATEPRPCVVTSVKTNGNNGEYTCELHPPSFGDRVTYNLGDGVPTARSVDPSLCEVFDGVDLTPNRTYRYGWFDNCGDGACTIRILNWFLGEEVIAATGEKADFIRLVAIAEAVDGLTGAIDDPNPFTNSHTLLIDEITISFFANGSNKKLAECQYDNVDVTFQSDPTP